MDSLCKNVFKPASVKSEEIHEVRDSEDPRHVTLSWAAAQGAEFYIVRFGPKANYYATTRNYQVYGATWVLSHGCLFSDGCWFVLWCSGSSVL